jgi:hypothetical protein
MALRGGAGTHEKITQLLTRPHLWRVSRFRTVLAACGSSAISFLRIAPNSPDRSALSRSRT